VADFPDGPEIALPAGDVTEGVVRIGDTVRRPHQPTSKAVAAYLRHLESVGFAGAPRYLGRDAQGRDVLDFVAGDVAGDPPERWAVADDVLPGVGRLVRSLHDASEHWRPDIAFDAGVAGRPRAPLPDGEPQLVAHRDVTPQNVVFRSGQAFALVDFDLVNWTTRSVDLANTAMHWIPLSDPQDRPAVYDGIDVAHRLRLLLDGYGTDAVPGAALLATCALRFAGLFESMRWNAEHLGGGWARMWDEGVGDKIRRRAEWFAAVQPQLLAALG
jgi:hypothetical protein